ncbi:MAG: UbiA family prenyltransferase [Lysobacteraceae bacterium]|nr:MAG: UbiA family prenyltransferase [Xanthomonadaceae bacterium]
MDTPTLASPDAPLCVDLDGTLLKSDLFHESVLALLRINPFYAFLLPWWLLKGKAALKREIASRVSLDPATLPYDERVLEVLRSASGRRRVLCTASDHLLVDPIARHLGLFDQVLASNGMENMRGGRKAEALLRLFGERGFDYMANERVDLQVWKHARKAWLVDASPALVRAAAALAPVAGSLPRASRGIRSWLEAARLHQWLKNVLVFVPLLASHRFLESDSVRDAALAFIAFGLCASGVYIINDLFDLHADRKHPRKRYRHFAAATLPLAHGLLAGPALALAGFAVAWQVNPLFTSVLAVYYLTTLAYSLRLKQVVMLDVQLLAALYTLRIIAGAAAIASGLSFWLLSFSMFIFLGLAMLKRYTELSTMVSTGQQRANGRDYEIGDLPLLQALGCASGYIAVLVLALYINSPESVALYSRPQLLWLLCPLLLYWTSRVWVVAHRGGMDDDPIVFAVTDRASLAIIAGCGLIVFGAM